MDDAGQGSIENLIIVGLSLALAAIVVVLSFSVMGLKDSIRHIISAYVKRSMQLVG